MCSSNETLQQFDSPSLGMLSLLIFHQREEHLSFGAEGFEPPHGGTKNRCLTAWRRPKRGAFSSQVEPLGD